MTCQAHAYVVPTAEKAHPVSHGQFTIERAYPASPERVFATWTDPGLKAQWFVGPDGWTAIRRELDVRVGGAECLHGRIGEVETRFEARYHDVSPNERLAYVYDMFLNGCHHSVSLATVEFRPSAEGTTMIFTEQVAFLDGTDGAAGTASREHGTAAHLDRLTARL